MLDNMIQAIDGVKDSDVSFADIRHQDIAISSISVVNGVLRRMQKSGKAGTVARALVGECWGQASTTDPVTTDTLFELLSQATKMAKNSARHSRRKIDLSSLESYEKKVWQSVKEDPSDVPEDEKLSIIMDLDVAQKVDERIVNTNSGYSDVKVIYRLVNTIGSRLEWNEVRTMLFVNPVARSETKTHFDYGVKSGMAGFELIRSIDPNEFSSKVGEGAIALLSAEKPPSGEMTAVVDGDIAGLIAHEVCGHASEADEVVKGRSFLTGLVGKEVGTEHVSMIDDGSISGLRGSFPFDSEGTPSGPTTIIENGIFKGYLHTLETAAIMGVKPTGNGRAQDYNRRIFARMSNTFFDTGDWSEEEIIEDTKDGIYIMKALSGMEDVVGGGVQATSLKGYIIKNGELTTLVRSLAITGKVLEILKTVDAVGNKLDFFGGNCGKGEEDYIPVSSGGPNMRMKLVVGGA
ncbi:MAG: TldD/PmbA family protein [Candidatus Thorarchaeota archaeon]